MPGKCKFRDSWLENERYSQWLKRVVGNPREARCEYCKKTFDIGNMGEHAVKSHVLGKKHIERSNSEKRNKSSINNFMCSTTTQPGSSKCSSDHPTTIGKDSQTVLQASTFGNNDTLSAETFWALKCMDAHYSYRSCEKNNLLFQTMFPDSNIAKSFTCGESKCAYLCCFGLAPHFRSLLCDRVTNADGYVLLFDESHNKATQTKQMDFHVRIWEADKVQTRYFNSAFLGHSTANDMLSKFKSGLTGLRLSNMIQLSMDGPTVNWKLYSILCDEIIDEDSAKPLNIGSCGLHIVHGAFMDGAKKSHIGVDTLLSSLYWLFVDSPARREDFNEITGTNSYPLKFCKHRWLENQPVAARALEIWPSIVKYVETIKMDKKKYNTPTSHSYEVVKNAVSDLMTPVKLAFFESVAKQITPFLTLYQTDTPMVPFLGHDLEKMLRGLMTRFVKPDTMSKASSALKLIKIDVEDENHKVTCDKVDLGFAAGNKLKSSSLKNISDRQKLEMKGMCRSFLVITTAKLLNKSPLKYSLVRNLSCLDPRQMISNRQDCSKKFKDVITKLVEVKRLMEKQCDDVIWQYNSFLDTGLQNDRQECVDFHPGSGRVDELFHRLMANKDEYSKLWYVVKLLLLISHGQATVERGFSVNKQIMVENMKEKSFVAQRAICDHISNVGGVLNVKMTKQLMMSCAGARQKYYMYLDEEKRKEKSHNQSLKRKTVNDELDDLKKKRKMVEDQVKSLQKSADEFAEKAETKGNLNWIVKSNSLRRTAKDKMESIKEINTQIDEVLLKLKSN